MLASHKTEALAPPILPKADEILIILPLPLGLHHAHLMLHAEKDPSTLVSKIAA